MKKITWEEYELENTKGLVCLIPLPDSGLAITCHEHTLCDHKVVEKMRKAFHANDAAYEALLEMNKIKDKRINKLEKKCEKLIKFVKVTEVNLMAHNYNTDDKYKAMNKLEMLARETLKEIGEM